MKRTESKLSIPGIGNERLNNPYEIIYADPQNEEIHMNFLKRVQLNAHMARWFLEYEYNQLIWSDGIFEMLEINPRKHGATFNNFLDVVHPDDRKIKNRVQEELKSTKKPIEINYRLLFNDGRIKWINEICNTDFDYDGNPVRSYGTIQDITKYKQAEATFIQKEEQFNNLIESIPSLIAIIQNNKIEYINPAGIRMLEGNNHLKVSRKKITLIISKSSRRNFNKKLKSVISGNFEAIFEGKMIRMDGYEFEAEVQLLRATHNGSPAVQLIANDITIRKKAEEALHLNEEKFQKQTINFSEKGKQLKELIATKDRFFSIIAHDLRSPFNNIIGFLELLINQYEEFNDSERKNYLSLIDDDAHRTLKLLDDLLDMARVKTGKMSFQPHTQKLLPIIESVSNTFTSALNFKKASLKYDISDDLETFADTNMLTSIVRNLISNAIKYSNPHGTITINALQVNNQIEITVTDNGIGMSEATKNKLFQLDLQVSIPGTANEKGSGLGLILCKDFIEKHEGKIRVESELGKGSKFIFTLPNSIC
jgi:PAS domain S-box-containing protein